MLQKFVMQPTWSALVLVSQADKIKTIVSDKVNCRGTILKYA